MKRLRSETAMCLNGDTITWTEPGMIDRFKSWFANLIDLKYGPCKHVARRVKFKDVSVHLKGFGEIGSARVEVANVNGVEEFVDFHSANPAIMEVVLNPISPDYGYFEQVSDDVAIVQIFNPRDERWIKINRFEGLVMSQKKSELPYKGVPILGWW